jgi:hypothetical protein
MLEIRNGLEELLEFGEAQNDGELPRAARIHDMADRPVFFQGHPIEKS